MHPVFIQTIYYAALMILTIFMVSMFFRGFFLKYVKVRLSFGKYAMVKVRTILRDYFAVGWIDGGMLAYKHEKKIVRIAITDTKKAVYRCMNVFWFDVDEEKNALAYTDYSAVTGFDSKKFSDLLVRALMKPSIKSGYEKIVMFALVIMVVVLLAVLYLTFKNNEALTNLGINLPGMFEGLKGTIIGGSNNI